MMSLFSPFDLFFFYLSYTFLPLVLISLDSTFWKSPACIYTFSFIKSLILFFYSLKSKMFSKGSLMFFSSTFLALMILNLTSVFPFIFPTTSSFGSMMSISLIFWLGFILFYVIKNMCMFLSHLIPEGAPLGLSFLLFLIEVVSSVIRPLTLTVRLVANILAGHLLMILLSKLAMVFSPVVVLYALLNMVEIFVSLIQAYIFCTMLALYYSEIH